MQGRHPVHGVGKKIITLFTYFTYSIMLNNVGTFGVCINDVFMTREWLTNTSYGYGRV